MRLEVFRAVMVANGDKDPGAAAQGMLENLSPSEIKYIDTLANVLAAHLVPRVEGVEPVAWMYECPGSLYPRFQSYEGMSCIEEDEGMIETKLYPESALASLQAELELRTGLLRCSLSYLPSTLGITSRIRQALSENLPS